MNHLRVEIVFRSRNRDNGVMALLFAVGSESVEIVCRCIERRTTAGATASLAIDGGDVMVLTRRIASG
jgi:hypothetical protein